jgi:AcrR family transcriptional regulator
MGRAPATGRTRLSAEARRGLIVEAAKDCIAETGLTETTAREVAARAQISIGTLTHHFSSMDELLLEALGSASREFTERVIATLAGGRTARDRVVLLIDAALPSQPPALQQWRLWLDYWARAAHDPRLATLHSERYRHWRGAFEHVIREGVRSGELAHVDARRAAKEIAALFDGFAIALTLGDEAIEAEEAREILIDFVDRLLRPGCPRESVGEQDPERGA